MNRYKQGIFNSDTMYYSPRMIEYASPFSTIHGMTQYSELDYIANYTTLAVL